MRRGNLKTGGVVAAGLVDPAGAFPPEVVLESWRTLCYVEFNPASMLLACAERDQAK